MRVAGHPAPNVEEAILYALLVVVGAIPVVTSIANHARFGFDATLGLLMLVAGAVGLLVRGRPRH